MQYIFIILSIALPILMFVLSLVFKVAGKLRLSLPVIWFLLIAFPLNRWASANDKIAWGVLIALCAIVLISWIFSLVKVIKRKKEENGIAEARLDFIMWQREKAHTLGYEDSELMYDEDGFIRDAETGERINIK